MIVYNINKLQICDEREKDYLSIDFMEPKKWERFLNAFMQHLIYRYGRSEVDSWRVEYWFNECQWKKSAFDQYFELFDITYRTIKKYSEGMEVGGSGLRLDLDAKLREYFFTLNEAIIDIIAFLLA